MDWIYIIVLIVKCIIITLGATTIFAYFTLFERKTLARMQNRIGPNRAGYIPLPGGRKLLNGFLQPVAEAGKLFFKEDVVPLMADKWVYILAPAFAVIPAIIIWATLPLGWWPGPWQDNWLQVADIDVGVLYILAVTSLGVYGLAIAGWSSNSKYSMLGGVRASAQVISYELALGLAVLGVVMQAQSFRTSEIVAAQQGMWNIIPQILGFVIFLVASTAEVVRSPFDLVEAEQELVGGYNTEFGSMKFALFFMTEYIKLVAMNAVCAMLFLGGWTFPGLEIGGVVATGLNGALGQMFGQAVFGIITLVVFLLKTFALSFFAVWIRATIPRTRYDQLMDLGWKVLLPLALVNIAIIAVTNVAFPDNTLAVAGVGFVAGIIVLAVVTSQTKSSKPKSQVTLVRKTS
ncbi:NADH-quinone oxidoreductase subunit H [Chloroflexia bacterium SDU3-3]|nr:NADH-quinone oxidoreductase subunit H [Chloroflexia bacterium SDU3-3]